MLQNDRLEELSLQFQRIFTLPVTRTTFRELHNAVLALTKGNAEEANAFMDKLVFPERDKEKAADPLLREFFKNYAVPVRVAKEVHERGEALSMLTTDMGVRGENLLFSTRIRRIDGQEFHFLADPEGLLHVVEHLLARLNDANRSDIGKEILEDFKPRLEKVRDMAERLV